MSASREDERSPYLQPTYQTILINALNAVLTKLIENQQIGAYFALKATHEILPDKVKTEISGEWEKYMRDVHSFSSTAAYVALRIEDRKSKVWQYLSENNYPLYGQIKDSLEKHKYLKFDFGAHPQNPKGGRFA